MHIEIHLKDESKLDFLLQLLGELRFVEVRPMPDGVAKKKKKFTAEQQDFIDGLKESLEEVELHLQGKIRLSTWEEFKAELALEEEVAA